MSAYAESRMKDLMSKGMVVGALIVVCLALNPRDGLAQGCIDCIDPPNQCPPAYPLLILVNGSEKEAGYLIDYCEDDTNCIAFMGQFPSCTVLAALPIEALKSSVRDGDMKRLANLLRTDARVALNRKRNAIQVYGCNGNIVANIPMTRRAVAALDSERHRLQLASRSVTSIASGLVGTGER